MNPTQLPEPTQPAARAASNEPSPEAEAVIRRAFQMALDAAVPPYDLGRMGLLAQEDQEFIRNEVTRKLYEPKLPCGGARERRILARLNRLAGDRQWEGHFRAGGLAKAWLAVLPDCTCNGRGCPQCWGRPGRYYNRRPMTLRDNKEEFEWLQALREAARQSRQWDRKWFAELRLGGLPEPVSNFEIKCLFLVRGEEGPVCRLVELRNTSGETSRLETLDARSFAGSEKLQEWCNGCGNFNWFGGTKEVQLLREDVFADSAFRTVQRIELCGWKELKAPKQKPAPELSSDGNPNLKRRVLDGIWFFDDCAFACGQRLLPDENNIYWLDGEGYYHAPRGWESEFLQGRPRMHPSVKLGDCDLDVAEWHEQPAAPNEAALYRAYFREICRRLQETLGGPEAYLALGAMFAYAAAPEIVDQYGLFPGLWVHGQMQSGKTSLVEWLLHFWGFRVASGTGKKGTAVGILQQAGNYSNAPFWVDEFRQGETGEDVVGVLRDAYNRQSSPKWTKDGVLRKIRTAFVVSGESTSSDAATRSRYSHVQVSASRRLTNHLEWFTRHKKHFFLFTRLLMERREEFASQVLSLLKVWMKTPGLAEVSERDKIVHGIHWAAWMAMVDLLESHPQAEVTAFKTFLVAYTRGAAEDVSSETNINIFWTDLITAWKADAIPASCFRLKTEYRPEPPGAEGQGRWASHCLFIDPDATLSALDIWLAKKRANLTLKRKDLRDQLSKNLYWMPGKLRQRFGPGAATTACWAIRLDLHPLGYQRVTNEEYEQSLRHPEEGDPRKGPLFAIVHALEHREQEPMRW